MSTTLKIDPLQDRTPIKVNLSLHPGLHKDLRDCAAVHVRAFGREVTIADIAPSMLRTLIDSDAGFKCARKQLKSKAEDQICG